MVNRALILPRRDLTGEGGMLARASSGGFAAPIITALPSRTAQSILGQPTGGRRMRFALSGVAVLISSIAPFAWASTETCGERAQNCTSRWGNPQAICFESFRLAACEKTGRYVAPNGNVWPAVRTIAPTG
jgi:hypothetical protein